jgi:SAM-dependent methyltransferase
MFIKGNEKEHWESIALKQVSKGYSNEILAEHKKTTYLSLITRWARVDASPRILKTDLFAEAFNQEQFLFDLAPTRSIIGLDIAAETVRRAKREAGNRGIDAGRYLCGDVRSLPLRDGSIDLVISDSTLDHFPTEADIIASLKELGRVLRPGGMLILTIDNNRHITHPPYFLFRLWMKLGLTPYFIGRTMSRAKLTAALDKAGMDVEESTAILHYPHPDGLVRRIEQYLHKLGRGRFDNTIRKWFACLEKLEGKRVRYLTGRYLAIKAIKREGSSPEGCDGFHGNQG